MKKVLATVLYNFVIVKSLNFWCDYIRAYIFGVLILQIHVTLKFLSLSDNKMKHTSVFLFRSVLIGFFILVTANFYGLTVPIIEKLPCKHCKHHKNKSVHKRTAKYNSVMMGTDSK